MKKGDHASFKPRAFKRFITISKGSGLYRMEGIQEGWMNSTILREWLLVFNAKIARESRRTIVLLDNFTGHEFGITELSLA